MNWTSHADTLVDEVETLTARRRSGPSIKMDQTQGVGHVFLKQNAGLDEVDQFPLTSWVTT